MTIIIRVEGATKWNTSKTIPLNTLYLMGSKGADNVNSEIGMCGKFLQRKLQTLLWQLDGAQRAKEYIRSLIMGNSDTDYFLLVPLPLILESLLKKIKEASSEMEKSNYKTIVELVKADMESGTQYYITDGQNRLFEALLPFFNNELALSTKPDFPCTITKENDSGADQRIHLQGKSWEDLKGESEILDYIKNIHVPLAIAEGGDIESFLATLIAKNAGVSWNDWQKVRTTNTFTDFNKQILTIVDDGLIEDKIFKNLGGEYLLDNDGYEKFAAELLIWMSQGIQPDKNDLLLHKKYFIGELKVTTQMVSDLKTFLRELAKGVKFSKKSNATLIRNWVMWRYAIAYPHKFKNLNIPLWNIQKKVEFAANFVIAHQYLYNEEGAKTYYKKPDGSKGTFKTPQMFPWACSEYRKDLLDSRLLLLSEYYNDPKEYKNPMYNRIEGMGADLIKRGVVTVRDDSSMLTKEELYYTNPHDNTGSRLDAVEIVAKRTFERGHVIPKSKSGSNTDLVFQNKKSNRSYGAVEVDI